MLGAAAVVFAASHYPIGTLQRIGPGVFPVLLGVILVVLGAWIALQSILGTVIPYDRDAADSPALAATLAALAGFALTVERFGVVPAILVLVGILALLRERRQPLAVLALAAALSILAIVIFQLLLGLAIRPFAWPLR